MPTIEEQKVKTLLKRLIFATRNNEITWTQTDRDQAFVYATASTSVLIFSVDNDGRFPYELQVLNDKGSALETVRSHTGSSRAGYDGTIYEEQLRELHTTIKRRILGVDEALDGLINSLTDPDEPPF